VKLFIKHLISSDGKVIEKEEIRQL